MSSAASAASSASLSGASSVFVFGGFVVGVGLLVRTVVSGEGLEGGGMRVDAQRNAMTAISVRDELVQLWRRKGRRKKKRRRRRRIG